MLFVFHEQPANASDLDEIEHGYPQGELQLAHLASVRIY